MKAHEGDKGVDIGDRHGGHVVKLRDGFVYGCDVRGESSRGIVLEGHAFFQAAHKMFVRDGGAGERVDGEDARPRVGATGARRAMIVGEHFKERAEVLSRVLERLPEPVPQNVLGSLCVRGHKGQAHGGVHLFFLVGVRGPFNYREHDDPEELGSDGSKQLSTKGEEAPQVFDFGERAGDISQLLPTPYFGTVRPGRAKSSLQIVGLRSLGTACATSGAPSSSGGERDVVIVRDWATGHGVGA